jgi:hypothetical protein
MRKQPIGTLADPLRANQALYLHCEACRYSARMELELKALARALGETMLLARIVRRAVCIICGARAPEVVAVCPSAR